MKQNSGDRSLVALVSGEDHYNHFTVAGSPRGRLAEEDFDLCRRDAKIKRRVLYEGSDPSKGKRYSGRWKEGIGVSDAIELAYTKFMNLNGFSE